MDRRFREPSDSLKLVMIVVAIPLIVLAMIPYWGWLMLRLAGSRVRRLVLRR